MDPGVQLTITSVDDRESPPIVLSPDRWATHEAVLLEDGQYNLSLQSSTTLGAPVLELQGYSLDSPLSSTQQDDITIWKWRPNEYVFRNCFGLAVLRVRFKNGIVFEFPPVEVMARKLKAEQARLMLQIIWEVSPTLLYAVFARTGFGVKDGIAPPSVERVINQADAILKTIEKLVYSSHNKVRKKLVETTQIKSLSPGDVIDDRAAVFAMNHLDYASKSATANSIAVPIRYQHIYFDRLAVVRKVESTNVYENGIIHGVLHNMEHRLIQIHHRLQDVSNEISSLIQGADSNAQYTRFQVVCGYYVHQVSELPKRRVLDMIRRVRRCRRHAERRMPATPIRHKPRLTPTFSTKPQYRPIFREIYNWYRMGDGLSLPQDLILGLKTLDRLYEYVSLLALLQVFQTEGWELAGSSSSEPSPSLLQDHITDIYSLRHPQFGHLELRYEPPIPPASSGSTLWGLVKVSGSRQEAYRPDFVLHFDRGPSKPIVVVLDAKYSTFDVMRRRYLPEMVLKYLHGVAWKGEVQGEPLNHLWLIGPLNRSRWDYQSQIRAISGRPSIGLLPLLPGDGFEHIKKWYHQIIVPLISC